MHKVNGFPVSIIARYITVVEIVKHVMLQLFYA